MSDKMQEKALLLKRKKDILRSLFFRHKTENAINTLL